MATIKISDLNSLTPLNSNTSNVFFVATDRESGVTGKISGTTLAEGLYANNVLNVGNNEVLFPGVIGQFVGNNQSYLQINLENNNANGSADYVITSDLGSDVIHYLDLGFQNSNANVGILYPNDGYLYVQGNTSNNPGGNLIIATTTQGRDIIFAQGGYYGENVVAKLSYASGLQLLQKPITFADGTTQNTSSLSAGTYANGAFIQANAAFLVANTPTHVANSAALYANGAFTQANAAFTKANNALANATGTFAGDLTVTGNTNILYQLNVHNSNMPGNTQFILVTGTANNVISEPSNPGYTFHSAIDGGNRVAAESYGANSVNYPAFIGRRARGTAESPSAVQNGDIITRLGGNGYGSTKFSQFSDARIEFVAIETHTDSSKGTQIQFWTTPSGSNTASMIGTMNGNTVTFTGTVNPAKGFVYTANVLQTVTSLNIDFNRDNLLKIDVNADLTISLSNYVYGKVVELWITNSAAQNKTITHGCLANNSTTKATTFTILAGSCAYLRYFSINGDNANTYVSVTA